MGIACMNKAKQNRYISWLNKAQDISDKFEIDLYKLIAIADEIQVIKSLYNSVEAEDFINFYLENKT